MEQSPPPDPTNRYLGGDPDNVPSRPWSKSIHEMPLLALSTEKNADEPELGGADPTIRGCDNNCIVVDLEVFEVFWAVLLLLFCNDSRFSITTSLSDMGK